MTPFFILVILAVLIAAAAWWYYRGRHMGSFAQAIGMAPAIPEAKPQGAIRMLKMPAAKG